MSRRRILLGVALLLLLFAGALGAEGGDAEYGKQMLRMRQCVKCHAVEGEGGSGAPDLGKRPETPLSPTGLAAKLWNHAPEMFEGMRAAGLPFMGVSEIDASNLYAYLYSIQYFDPPGDVARGELVFAEKACLRCHAVEDSAPAAEPADSAGPPVKAWSDMADPVLWAQSMWNHGEAMAAAMAAAKIDWPRLNVQEMVDVLAFVHSQPAHQGSLPYLRLGDWVSGERDFTELGCVECHTLGESVAGKVDLLETARRQPLLSGLAVEMWNHRPAMETAAGERGVEVPRFEADQMADVASYLFRQGYFQAAGDAARGAALYRGRGCAGCHDTGEAGAPAIGPDGSRPYSAIRLASAVWMHGPNMKAQMDYLEKSWPQLSEQDVEDLLAFVNSR